MKLKSTTQQYSIDRKSYWDDIYIKNMTHQTGWFQEEPHMSIDLIRSAGLPKNARIIDIGGGDSLFVDHILGLGFENITVLDVSEKAIERAKNRLGKQAEKVTWVTSDILDFDPKETYDLWHDRACLHFLTKHSERLSYAQVAKKVISFQGTLIIGAFSKTGPHRCSGLPIKQFTSEGILEYYSDRFEHIESRYTVHLTPSKNEQNYVFCRLKKITI